MLQLQAAGGVEFWMQPYDVRTVFFLLKLLDLTILGASVDQNFVTSAVSNGRNAIVTYGMKIGSWHEQR